MNADLDLMFDASDRIVRIAAEQRDELGYCVGHPLWTLLPAAEPILAPYLEHARSTGETVESTDFYAGGTVHVRVAPEGELLALRLRRGTELDVRTLETLATSLRRIEEELAAREPVPRDRPARESPQALP